MPARCSCRVPSGRIACAGAPVREWSVPDVATSAAAADVALCHSPYANWSAHGEWCDFSAPAGPTLQGVYFADSSDCSTAGALDPVTDQRPVTDPGGPCQ